MLAAEKDNANGIQNSSPPSSQPPSKLERVLQLSTVTLTLQNASRHLGTAHQFNEASSSTELDLATYWIGVNTWAAHLTQFLGTRHNIAITFFFVNPRSFSSAYRSMKRINLRATAFSSQ